MLFIVSNWIIRFKYESALFNTRSLRHFLQHFCSQPDQDFIHLYLTHVRYVQQLFYEFCFKHGG